MSRIKCVLLLGSTGMLGGHFLKEFSNYPIKIITPLRSDLIFKNYQYLKDFIIKSSADLVINCISQNGINACFENRLNAFTVNSLYPQFLSKVCEELNLKLILFSSEMVFDDLKTPASIKSNPKPSTTYGLTKFFGEVNIRNNTIIRLPLLVSKKRNRQIVWKLLDCLSMDKAVKVSDDEYSTPIFAEDLAHEVVKLSLEENIPKGYIHFSSSNRITLHETVSKLANNLGINVTKLFKCSANDFPTMEIKPRYSGLTASHEFSYLKFL